nr:hypothetical protein [Tanacetum cinerariifolium]
MTRKCELLHWASLRNLSDADFLDRVNLNSAQHVCMVSKLRLRYEHEITTRGKFEKKFTDSSEVIEQRDAEIVELRSKLDKAEGAAADVVKLRRQVQVSGLESVHDGLKGKVVELEYEYERLRDQVEGEAKLKDQFMAIQDYVVRCLVDCSSALDARLSELSYQVDSKLYPHMLTVVAGRRSGGDLENISLPFLARLKSYKDDPLEHVMTSLYLAGSPNKERGSRVPSMVFREVLLGEALEASLAQNGTTIGVVSRSIFSCHSLPPENGTTVPYTLRTVTKSEPHDLSSVDSQRIILVKLFIQPLRFCLFMASCSSMLVSWTIDPCRCLCAIVQGEWGVPVAGFDHCAAAVCLSTCPLVCGCLTDVNLCLIFNFSHQSLNGLS